MSWRPNQTAMEEWMDKCLWEYFLEWKDTKLLCVQWKDDDEIETFNWRDEFLKDTRARLDRVLAKFGFTCGTPDRASSRDSGTPESGFGADGKVSALRTSAPEGGLRRRQQRV